MRCGFFDDWSDTIRDAVVFYFVVFWILLSIGNWIFFWQNRDARLKRRLWPWAMWLMGGIFAAFTAFVGGSGF